MFCWIGRELRLPVEALREANPGSAFSLPKEGAKASFPYKRSLPLCREVLAFIVDCPWKKQKTRLPYGESYPGILEVEQVETVKCKSA